MTEEEQQLFFEIKSKFFGEIPHPKLIRKTIDQLIKTRPGKLNFQDGVATDLTGETDIRAYLETYLVNLANLKMRISKSENADQLVTVLGELLLVQNQLVTVLSAQIQGGEHIPDNGIKQSAPMDVYEILRFIKANSLQANQIKGYICDELANKESEEFSVLTRACIQCLKIKLNGRTN